MTKTLEITPELQTEINRRLWIQALRENGHRQCFRRLRDGDGNVCAVGLAYEIFEADTYIQFKLLMGWPMFKSQLPEEGTWPAMDNDRGMTFSQIADAAEKGRYW